MIPERKPAALKARKRRVDTDVPMLAMCAFFPDRPTKPWVAMAEFTNALAKIVGPQTARFGVSGFPTIPPDDEQGRSRRPKSVEVPIKIDAERLRSLYVEANRGFDLYGTYLSIDGHFEYYVDFDNNFEDESTGRSIIVHVYLDSVGQNPRKSPTNVRFQATSPLTDLARAFFRGVDLIGGAASGYAGCDIPRQMGGGFYYGLLHTDADWYREIAKLDWNLAGQARWGRVRSPEWGIYIGANLLEKADPDRVLVEGFVRSDRGEPFAAPFAEYLPGGGALFLASANPAEMIHYGIPGALSETGVVRNTVWLWQRLRERGLV